MCGQHTHPNADKDGIILEHRLVMSNALSRPLKSDECVHHIDGNPRNNDLSNLELTTNSQHTIYHKTTGRTMIKLVCAYCNNEFERDTRQVTNKFNKGQKNFYCNNSCSAKNSGRSRLKE